MYALLENKRKEMEKGGFTHLQMALVSIINQTLKKEYPSSKLVSLFLFINSCDSQFQHKKSPKNLLTLREYHMNWANNCQP